MSRTIGAAALLVCLTSGLSVSEEIVPGLSRLGKPFDEGPRLKPWRMEGLGKVAFPITTSNPEAQEWFNQGVALIHVYFWNEAERTFRWVLKLDPDCAMAYWGLSMSTHGKRARQFLDMALERRDKVSERERRWLEAWDARTVPDTAEELIQGVETRPTPRKRIYTEARTAPTRLSNDVEFRLFHGHECYRRARRGRHSDDDRAPDRLACETVLQQVLETNPDHPGAHHYRIHNWDGPMPASWSTVLITSPRSRRTRATLNICRVTSSAGSACGTRLPLHRIRPIELNWPISRNTTCCLPPLGTIATTATTCATSKSSWEWQRRHCGVLENCRAPRLCIGRLTRCSAL